MCVCVCVYFDVLDMCVRAHCRVVPVCVVSMYCVSECVCECVCVCARACVSSSARARMFCIVCVAFFVYMTGGLCE